MRSLVHEVGNLLAAVRMSGHFLGGEISGADRQQLAREVEMLAALAGACIAQIRQLLGENMDRRTQLALGPLLNGAARTVQEVLPDPSCLALRVHKRLPEVRVDADGFHHLLVLLLIGSVTASTRQDVKVRMATAVEERRVIVRITDDGPPLHEIPTEARPGRRGRELWLSIAGAVLRAGGGGMRITPRRRGTQVELLLAAVRHPLRPAPPSVCP